MTKKQFLTLIQNEKFSFSEGSDLYYCDDNLNITMEFLTKDDYKDEYDIHFYLKENGGDPKHFSLDFYYNDILIHSECGIYSSKIMNVPLLLPYPSEYTEDDKLVDVEYIKSKAPITFIFNENKIHRFNKLVDITSGNNLEFSIDYLKNNPKIKFK